MGSLDNAVSIDAMIENLGQQAKLAASKLVSLSAEIKNRALRDMADLLDRSRSEIQKENQRDIAAAPDFGLSEAMVDRLKLTDARIDGMITGLRQIADLDDPVGTVLEHTRLENGLDLSKTRMPLGVLGIIYESRPNVTVDAAALCFKSGNAVILRGGKEAQHSNQVLTGLLRESLRDTLQNVSPDKSDLSAAAADAIAQGAISRIELTDRDAVRALVQAVDYVDVIIPRGGLSLIKAVERDARVPVLKHYNGICHIFVDEGADYDRAIDIVENAKCQRPGVCNALETLLVHEQAAATCLPAIVKRLSDRGVTLVGDSRVCEIAPQVAAVTEEDWVTEYLDLKLSIKVVSDVDDAIAHINTYGSHHSDSILTANTERGERFVREVDSAAVYINASTRFTDGGVFGMGAEIGISTDKMHARGPVGVNELTTYKWIIRGKGQVR